ncbi:MAG: glycosyltransferase family 4 protein [Acidobacteriota bacterium]
MAECVIQNQELSKIDSILPCVDISVGSRFHAFDLARELQTCGMLRALHTGYPAFAAKRFGLSSDHFHSVWSHEPLNRSLSALYRHGLLTNRLDFTLSRRFDRIVAGRLKPGANIFVGWSSQCLSSLRKASDCGMLTIVERGSTHIEWQRNILQEESQQTGAVIEIPDTRVVERELAEYAEADFIAVPSRFVANTFIARGIKKEKLIVNPYGVDLGRFQPRSEKKNTEELQVIHVGRVSIQKGVHYLVPAVKKISGAILTLVGMLDPGMEKLIYQPHTRVVGPVAGVQLPAYYSQADIFCLLSLQEGLALVIAQAMAMGLPVIATRNSGAEELITDGVEGFIVPIRDPDAVSEKLHLLAVDKSLRVEMGQRARAKILQGFSWSDYGQRARDAYQSILLSRRLV